MALPNLRRDHRFDTVMLYRERQPSAAKLTAIIVRGAIVLDARRHCDPAHGAIADLAKTETKLVAPIGLTGRELEVEERLDGSFLRL